MIHASQNLLITTILCSYLFTPILSEDYSLLPYCLKRVANYYAGKAKLFLDRYASKVLHYLFKRSLLSA